MTIDEKIEDLELKLEIAGNVKSACMFFFFSRIHWHYFLAKSIKYRPIHSFIFFVWDNLCRNVVRIMEN